MTTSPQHLLIEHQDGVTTLKLNRPEVLNALSRALVRELSETLDTIAADDAARVLVLTGGTRRAFSAGADIHEMEGLTAEENLARHILLRDLTWKVANLAQPVIAAIHGHCFGGAAALACACDMRLASETARFRFPGSVYGLAVGTWGLPPLVGPALAKELILSGRVIGAAEAERIGLVNRVHPSDELDAKVAELAQQIVANSVDTVQGCKALINLGVGDSLESTFARELEFNRERVRGMSVRQNFATFYNRERAMSDER